mgnify:CR=1 FL=1
MNNVYLNYVPFFKALADDTRIKIIDMLSCGELCACDILSLVDISQSTLSYHMKILTDSGLITSRKDGSWVRYSINSAKKSELLQFINKLVENKSDCICKDLNTNLKLCCADSKEIQNETRNN